ncbi:class I tRNA ligase family protein [Shigella flexneri]
MSTPPKRIAWRVGGCQTALYHIAEALVRWMAPILSFTADEVWGFLSGRT